MDAQTVQPKASLKFELQRRTGYDFLLLTVLDEEENVMSAEPIGNAQLNDFFIKLTGLTGEGRVRLDGEFQAVSEVMPLITVENTEAS